ncbi:aminotransferase class V-fold PLP-dependent enzyme [Ktedonosporobacter rubrisoli]|uniref:Aminotransferase class V-fold PLP-dependent enzyme n=1 Tax=Ktedonosporobacter rubrisoli TaxID=2509675 RepID=A0A4P6JI86_KTERU|nr:aminotransferase class V-fold PLP-dependent enzyme [Ktedonosporobacter rubrisoli]QBD74673.1 aminotransferase class V-fold PLP-dependent enzyme [Ktedonosporobacter rubrisoli]
MTDICSLPVAADQFQIRSDITFFNHGSFGACPRPVFAAYQEWQRRLEYDPIEFLGRRIGEMLGEARACLADYLGTRAEQIVFVTNTTVGVNIIARSLPLEPGDEVLATDHEYGASDRTWRFQSLQRGIHYINQPIPLPLESEDEMIEYLWRGVTSRTRVIFISHITSPTALTFPIARICQRARAAGILTVVDGAHAPGQIPLALDELGVDFYIGNCHKWLCAPKGSAFLYARPERQALLQPLVVSWGWESQNPGSSTFLDYFGWLGTDDPAAYLSVPAAIAFQHEHNWDAVRAACHELAASARAEISALLGTEVICPADPTWWSQMCIIEVPAGDVQVLQRSLREEWHIEIPVVSWGGRRFVRLSLQGYNGPADIERLRSALQSIFRIG